MPMRLLALAAVIAAGCALRAPIHTPGRDVSPSGPIAGSGGDLRGMYAPSSSWMHVQADSVERRLEAIAAGAREARVNALFFEVDSRGQYTPSPTRASASALSPVGPEGLDPLARAIGAAHSHGMRAHLWLALPSSSGDSVSAAPSETRPLLKRAVRRLVETYDLDGLHLAPVSDSGLVEDLVAEALLVKPHLLTSAQIAARGQRQATDHAALSSQAFARGLVDFIVPSGSGSTVFRIPSYPMRPRAERVVSLDLSAVVGAKAEGPVLVTGRERPVAVDAEGMAGFFVDALPDTLQLSVGDRILALPTSTWRPPYRYRAHADCTVSRFGAWVELRNAPPDTTSAAVFHYLFRTDPAAVARVNGDTTHVYRTGVFFDSLGLDMGTSRVRAEAVYPDSSRAVYEHLVVRIPDEPRAPFPLWIGEGSIEPRRDLELLPEDVVRVSFRGSPGQLATVRLRPGKVEIACQREDRDDYSEYRADVPLRLLRTGRAHSVELILKSAPDSPVRATRKHRLQATITVRHADEFPIVRTAAAESYLSYGQGRVRLGGPYLAEYGPGILLQTSGRIGDAYRVRLGPQRVGFIPSRQAEEMPPGTVRPGYTIYSLHAALSDSGDADVVRIPWAEPVPYIIYPDPAGKQLRITLYGVESSSTWIQHRSGMRFVERLEWEQIAPETYQVAVHLKDTRIWGYTLEPEGRSLVLRLPHPPSIGATDSIAVAASAASAGMPDSPTPPAASDGPFGGLRIAIEAGHGATNTGAIGLSGLPEKDVNLDTALRLGKLCRDAGIEVCQLRPADEGVPYMARRDSALAWGADLLVSIHANAGGSSRGYLRTGGTSTYYHNPFWAPFAERVYDSLLDLELEEFGVVGSFNYRVTRTAALPAVLVEQAFMSHAEDEEKLADPAFRQLVAERVFAGLSDYLDYMFE